MPISSTQETKKCDDAQRMSALCRDIFWVSCVLLQCVIAFFGFLCATYRLLVF